MRVNHKCEDFFQIRAGNSLKVSSRIASEFTNQERDTEKVVSLSD